MLIHPQFDPIAVSLGPLAVRWYGLMYLLGFVLFMLLARARDKSKPQLAFGITGAGALSELSVEQLARHYQLDLPPRNWPSEVIRATAPASLMRSRRDWAEKPPKTMEWMAPIRAQACMATTPSTVIGM